jgi:WXG100 family type VII secretion target
VGQPVEVVVSELHSASTRLDDAAQRLQDGLNSVNEETTALLGSGWKGGAASAYAPEWNDWHTGAQQVIEGLQRMSELLNIAGNEYAKTDESAAQGLGSTMQGGGAGSSPAGGSAPAPAPPSSAGAASAAGAPAAQSGEGMQQGFSSLSQLGQAAAQPLAQAGQAIAGLAQQGMQIATELAQQAEQAVEASGGDESTQAGPDEPGTGTPNERPRQ